MEDPAPADAQVKIRLTPGIRDALKVRAIQNRRTLMREIEYRVIESLKRDEPQLGGAQGAQQT